MTSKLKTPPLLPAQVSNLPVVSVPNTSRVSSQGVTAYPTSTNDDNHQLNLHEQLTFIFSPGTGCYFPQLTKYCESVSFRSPLNSAKIVKLQHPRACPVIGQDHYCVHYPEIDISTPLQSPLHYLLTRHLSFWQGKYTPHPLYCNLVRMRNFNFSQQLDIAALEQQYQQWLLDNDLIAETAAAAAANALTTHNHHMFDSLVNTIADGTNVAVATIPDGNNVVVNQTVINSRAGGGSDSGFSDTGGLAFTGRKKKKKPLVLFGSSRGAGTIITWCSAMKEHVKSVDAIILEGCPSSIDDIYKYDPTWVNYCRRLLLSNLTTYDSQGPTASSCLLDLPRDIPIYFIASVKDEVVPYECSQDMVSLLRQHGYSNIRMITLKSAPHSGYLTHNPEDRLAYYSALQELYQQLLTSHGR